MGTRTHKLKKLDNRIWKYRKISNLSQRQVSFLLALKGTSQISKWEKGVKIPSLENAIRLSQILKVSVEELFSGIGERLDGERTRRAVNQDLTGSAPG